jgi:small conductance mechanosensitive channel
MVRRARRQAVLLLLLLAGVVVAYANRKQFFGRSLDTPVRAATVVALVVLGWAFARDVGRAAAPTFFRRLHPATAGTAGFLIRFLTLLITGIAAVRVAGLKPQTLAVGGAFTAVVLGLAAQQTLGNLIAGMVLLSARPFRVGERVRLQAGPLAGRTEGVVSSLGLLYTTLARGEDRIMIPNSVVLSAAIVPVREPDPVDVKVRIGTGIRPSHVQAILDEVVGTPTRAEPRVLLEEIDGEDVVVRVQATPERASDGARLADEIIAALASITGEHPPVVPVGSSVRAGLPTGAARSDPHPGTTHRPPQAQSMSATRPDPP